MVKFVYCVRRHPSKTPEEFRKYWLENHGPLVKSVAKAIKARRYVQSHLMDSPVNDFIRQTRGTMEAYDGITEIWWDSIEQAVAASMSPEGQEANRRLAEDEARFCDLSKSSVFFSQEFTIFEN